MITIVIASYKYGHLGGHCIESIIEQSLQPNRILFVDDGVGDCKHLEALYPQVEFIHREKNLGTSKNFDDMLKRVKTDKVMFIGADNWLHRDTLEELNQSEADIVSYDITLVGSEVNQFVLRRRLKDISYHNDSVVWRFNPPKDIKDIKHSNFIHGSALYNTKLAQEFGYQNRQGGVNSEEDWNLWSNMIIKGGATHCHINKPMLYYRRHKNNFISN